MFQISVHNPLWEVRGENLPEKLYKNETIMTLVSFLCMDAWEKVPSGLCKNAQIRLNTFWSGDK